tara:strand:- start:1220 stop:1810 length:591 start_codon:yes stop_codon:yes gene_type:complete
MVTETSPLNRQPTKLDYTSPTQFRFLINQLPKVQYFTVSANVPGITLGDATYATPLKDIPLPGEKLTYDDLNITFIVDENLENYIEIHNWLASLGFPKNREQFKTHRSATSNLPKVTVGTSGDIGDVKPITSDSPMFSDSVLTVLSNKNNPVVECRFEDCFPTSLSSLDYSQNQTDVEYLTAEVTFKYKIYEIKTL